MVDCPAPPLLFPRSNLLGQGVKCFPLPLLGPRTGSCRSLERNELSGAVPAAWSNITSLKRVVIQPGNSQLCTTAPPGEPPRTAPGPRCSQLVLRRCRGCCCSSCCSGGTGGRERRRSAAGVRHGRASTGSGARSMLVLHSTASHTWALRGIACQRWPPVTLSCLLHESPPRPTMLTLPHAAAAAAAALAAAAGASFVLCTVGDTVCKASSLAPSNNSLCAAAPPSPVPPGPSPVPAPSPDSSSSSGVPVAAIAVPLVAVALVAMAVLGFVVHRNRREAQQLKLGAQSTAAGSAGSGALPFEPNEVGLPGCGGHSLHGTRLRSVGPAWTHVVQCSYTARGCSAAAHGASE